MYLTNLTSDQRKDLERQLLSTQHGSCFICGLKPNFDTLVSVDA
jgi:hypothetical protein